MRRSCPDMPAPCGWDDYNVTGAVKWQVSNGALVGGPLANDYYSDNRSDYQINEVALDYNAGYQTTLAGLIQSQLFGWL